MRRYRLSDDEVNEASKICASFILSQYETALSRIYHTTTSYFLSQTAAFSACCCCCYCFVTTATDAAAVNA
jgi:hypothetical protein